MKKFFPLFAAFIGIFASILGILGLLNLNQIRINQANWYYQESKTASNEDKIIFLLKSNALSPSAAKKSEIIDYFLLNNDFLKAEGYLKQDRSQTGKEKYAEVALEFAEFQTAEKIIQGLENSNKKEEYQIFLKFAQGERDAIKDLPKKPVTETGKILKAVNTINYKIDNPSSYIGKMLLDINQHKGKQKQFAAAQLMYKAKQYHISLFILENLEKDKNLAEVYALKAHNLDVLGRTKEALESQKVAISAFPENPDYYKTAIIYARTIGNLTESNYLSEKLRYLESIQK